MLEQEPEADEEANSLTFFRKTLNRFVAKDYRQGCRGNWISYIKKLSRDDKPQHMTIDQMVARLSTMQEELMRIPCKDNNVLLDSDIRNAVSRMSNETEQKELTRKFDGDPHTATLQQIQTVLETEEVSNIGFDDKHSGITIKRQTANKRPEFWKEYRQKETTSGLVLLILTMDNQNGARTQMLAPPATQSQVE
jgi:hypothetical protein